MDLRDLSSYPSYKQTGLWWLERVPIHWRATRLKHVARIQTGVTLGKDYRGLQLEARPYLRVANVQTGRLNLASVKKVEVPPDVARASELQIGDVLMTEGGDPDKLGRGCIWRGEVPGCLHQNHIFAVRVDSHLLLPEFLELLLESSHGRTYFLLHSKQTTNLASTNQTTVAQFPMFLPEIDEQWRILRFIAYYNRLIQKFIRNKRRLIELLNEQKQAIIDRAVTRGLDPNVRLKPSGVDWLGDVPEHWELQRLKYLVRNVNDQTESSGSDGIRVAMEHVESWTGKLKVPNGDIEFDSQVRRFRAGDILFGKLRPYLAKVCRPSQDGVCVSELLVLRPMEKRVLPSFLEQKLRSIQIVDLINSSTFGAKMPRADWTFIGDVVISFPPTCDEQQQILKAIHRTTEPLDHAIGRALREIDLIREYRTRLIADVVTGKLDVRDVAPESVAPPFDSLDGVLEEDDSAEGDLADVDRRGPNVEADNDDE